MDEIVTYCICLFSITTLAPCTYHFVHCRLIVLLTTFFYRHQLFAPDFVSQLLTCRSNNLLISKRHNFIWIRHETIHSKRFIAKLIIIRSMKTKKIIIITSGVARGGGGGGPPRVSPFWGDTICLFFSFKVENPLIGRQRPFFLVITYFRTENQLV